jgi:hypothetical protein
MKVSHCEGQTDCMARLCLCFVLPLGSVYKERWIQCYGNLWICSISTRTTFKSFSRLDLVVLETYLWILLEQSHGAHQGEPGSAETACWQAWITLFGPGGWRKVMSYVYMWKMRQDLMGRCAMWRGGGPSALSERWGQLSVMRQEGLDLPWCSCTSPPIPHRVCMVTASSKPCLQAETGFPLWGVWDSNHCEKCSERDSNSAPRAETQCRPIQFRLTLLRLNFKHQNKHLRLVEAQVNEQMKKFMAKTCIDR